MKGLIIVLLVLQCSCQTFQHLRYVRLVVLEDKQMLNVLKSEEVNLYKFRQNLISYLSEIFIAVNISIQIVTIETWDNDFKQNVPVNQSKYLFELKQHVLKSSSFKSDGNVVLLITG